jgi:hypothetical protein
MFYSRVADLVGSGPFCSESDPRLFRNGHIIDLFCSKKGSDAIFLQNLDRAGFGSGEFENNGSGIWALAKVFRICNSGKPRPKL